MMKKKRLRHAHWRQTKTKLKKYKNEKSIECLLEGGRGGRGGPVPTANGANKKTTTPFPALDCGQMLHRHSSPSSSPSLRHRPLALEFHPNSANTDAKSRFRLVEPRFRLVSQQKPC